ncbi:hypothetical protein, partial [Shigella sp. FC2125]|uniref:hypothetical protein n=1 Tax=Shigella sp. FC2125 TaxID=1898679 RepID=UPI001C0A7143
TRVFRSPVVPGITRSFWLAPASFGYSTHPAFAMCNAGIPFSGGSGYYPQLLACSCLIRVFHSSGIRD